MQAPATDEVMEAVSVVMVVSLKCILHVVWFCLTRHGVCDSHNSTFLKVVVTMVVVVW